jgi:hypothetical protein
MLMLISISTLTVLGFHSEKIIEKIQLEDTTLQALLTIEQSLANSNPTYCAPINKINNYNTDINTNGRYQVSENKITTYSKTPEYYLNTQINNDQKHIIINEKIPGDTGDSLILDDCEHAVIVKITDIDYQSKHQTKLTLAQATGIMLKPPIMLGTINITQFELNSKGLYRKIGNKNRVLIAPHISNINISKNMINIKAQDQDQYAYFQKAF